MTETNHLLLDYFFFEQIFLILSSKMRKFIILKYRVITNNVSDPYE
jgi:hypothetical protein